MIDLHTHSTCSDGTFSPEGLVHEAVACGITHLSLTDHDSFDGVAPAREAAQQAGIAFLAGLEISAEFQPGTMHILGYGFDETHPLLREKVAFVQQARKDRNPVIVKKLNGLGIDITMEEIAAEAGGDIVGRPHFAKVMLRKGYVKDNQEAFDKYLAKGMPAYMDKVRLGPEESIDCIAQAGGIPVLAHPYQLKVSEEEMEKVIGRLAGAGLRGLECYYKDHDDAKVATLLGLARRFNLLATGGSDFHGTNRPKVRLGIGEGNLKVPLECWQGLEAAVSAQRPGPGGGRA